MKVRKATGNLPRFLRYVPQTTRHLGWDDRLGKASPLEGVSYRRWGRAWRLGEEEGVGVAFAADGGSGAVAGVDYGFVGELEEFGL